IDAEIEGVADAVRRIDAHHQRALAEAGEPQTGGRREARLADPAFSSEQEKSHVLCSFGPLDRSYCRPRGVVYTHNWVDDPVTNRFATVNRRAASKFVYTQRF